MAPLDLIILRWQKARCHGLRYLAVGDGLKTLRTDYFPDSVYMTPEEVRRIRQSVFDGPKCGEGGNVPTVAPPDQNPWEKSCQGSVRLGRLRLKVEHSSKDAVTVLRESADSLEIVIKGMFGFCRAAIHEIRKIPRHERLGVSPWRSILRHIHRRLSAEDADFAEEPTMLGGVHSWRRTHGSLDETPQRIEVTYQGICMQACFEEPVDSPTHLTQSLQYGFDQAQIDLQVLRSSLEVHREDRFYWTEGNGDTRFLGIRLGSYFFFDVLFFGIIPLCVILGIALIIGIFLRINRNKRDYMAYQSH
jgi:hypothetical protein